MSKPPEIIKIYHILHIDKLIYILNDKNLFCDQYLSKKGNTGTTIGMDKIKRRRLNTPIKTHTNLMVGGCVPFYFCPRSVMLYIISKANHKEMQYSGGQDPILHLSADFYKTTDWADKNNQRWAFTDTNAGSSFFDDFNQKSDLDKLRWDVIESNVWVGNRDFKQAEFLIEHRFPIELIEEIGVFSEEYRLKVIQILNHLSINIKVVVKKEWYY